MKIKTSDIANNPYRVGFFFVATPLVTEILAMHEFADSVTFADDFAGSVCKVGVNPTATFVIDVKKNGSSIGSISISTLGVATFSTTGGAASFVSGDVISFVGPSPVDATVAQCTVTLKGTF